MVTLLITLAVLFLGYFTQGQPQVQKILGTSTPGYYQVVSFADGDTLTVNMDGKEEKVRLIGVDTPETHDPRKEVQCFGQAASDFTRQLIGNNRVRLESDSLSQSRDRYGRLLRYAYLPDGRLVQAEIIKNGYGFAYLSFPFAKSEEFSVLEREARENNRGLWSSCQTSVSNQGFISTTSEE